MSQMATPSVARLTASAKYLWTFSLSPGINNITKAPTKGRKTARVIPQLSTSSLMRPWLLDDDDEDGGEQEGSPEEEHPVLLHAAVLDTPQDLARFLSL